jgi:hypothetical protein
VIGVACSDNSLDRQRRPQLERDALLALWQDGVPLGHAWEVFADEWSATRYRELQRTDSHLGLKRLLKLDLIARLYAGELKAIGIEGASDAGPILIPQYYFSKTAEIDWEKGIDSALGKVFHEVRVQWQRESPDVARPRKPAQWIHSRELEAQWELGPPSAPEPFPGEQWEWEPLDDTLPNEPKSSDEPLIQVEQEAAEETPPSDPEQGKLEEAFAPSRGRGRPSKDMEVERAIDILMKRGIALAKLKRPEAFAAIRRCAASELNSDINMGFSDPVLERILFRRFGRRRSSKSLYS